MTGPIFKTLIFIVETHASESYFSYACILKVKSQESKVKVLIAYSH